MKRLRPILLLACIFSGCAYTKDITSYMRNYQPGPVPRLWNQTEPASNGYREYVGDYQAGVTYRLMRTAWIVDVKGCKFTEAYFFWPDVPRYNLEPPKEGVSGETIGFVAGEVSSGTTLRFDKLIYHNYFEDATSYPFAIILTGPHAGMRVSLSKISTRDFMASDMIFQDRFLQNPEWLELVPPPAH